MSSSAWLPLTHQRRGETVLVRRSSLLNATNCVGATCSQLTIRAAFSSIPWSRRYGAFGEPTWCPAVPMKVMLRRRCSRGMAAK